jgi:hypothetical protein
MVSVAKPSDMRTVPDHIEKAFRQVKNEVSGGDYRQFHLYCDYTCDSDAGPPDSLAWQYTISGTTYAVERNKGVKEEELEKAYLCRESGKFKERIERTLRQARKHLVWTVEGQRLVLVADAGIPAVRKSSGSQ